MQVKDYYKILGVDEKADAKQIKSSYRNLAKKFHPDANPGDSTAEDRFKEISEAYDVLGDEKKRRQYDQMKKYGGFAGRPGGAGFDFSGFDFSGFTGGGPGFRGGSGRVHGNSSSLFGDLGSIFSQFFDMGSAGAGPFKQSARGADTRVSLTIPFELSITGGKTSFTVGKEKTCTVCEGGGAKPGSTVETCSVCGGRGTVVVGQGGFGVSRPCSACFGRGEIVKNPCDRCHGSGRVEGKRTYTIRIPAGIESGKQIRLKGEGRPGEAHRPAGDMLVTVSVTPHRFFSRRGHHVTCEVKLSLKQAMRGSKVKVNTVHGNKVVLTIPPGTRDGSVLRIAGMGVHGKGADGDQLVTVKIKMPAHPSKEDQELIDEYERNDGQ
ncbi:J domain-containing protein [bacterium]|nr:J domain-containing protein [bacterium]